MVAKERIHHRTPRLPQFIDDLCLGLKLDRVDALVRAPSTYSAISSVKKHSDAWQPAASMAFW